MLAHVVEMFSLFPRFAEIPASVHYFGDGNVAGRMYRAVLQIRIKIEELYLIVLTLSGIDNKVLVFKLPSYC